jgi:hypothetical protein
MRGRTIRFTMSSHCPPLVQGQWRGARNVFQLLGHVLAQAAQGATAAGTIIVASGQLDLLAWDVIGNGTALRLVLLLFVRKPQLRSHRGCGNLARLERQLKLLDRLRRGAKAMASVAGQLMAQLLYQHRLRLHLCQQKRREPPQVFGVFRQGFGHVQHGKS